MLARPEGLRVTKLESADMYPRRFDQHAILEPQRLHRHLTMPIYSNKIDSMNTDGQSARGIRNHPIVSLIKSAIERNGFTSIGQFAERAGIARATVYNIMSDRAPLQLSLETFFKLEASLEVPAGELIELFKPTDHSAVEQTRIKALEGLRGKYAGSVSLSAELHAERRAERA
jgi:transcriptional regulator with XRE-family HTH domain